MEESRQFITINAAGLAESVEDESPALKKVCATLDCDLLEVVRSNVLDAGSDRRIVMLADDSGALRPNRKFNALASSASAQIIYGTVAFGEEICGPDGGEVVGLRIDDQARVLAFMAAVRSFMLRGSAEFIYSFVGALALGISSTVPIPLSAEKIEERLTGAVNGVYDAILEQLKAEPNAKYGRPGGQEDESDVEI